MKHTLTFLSLLLTATLAHAGATVMVSTNAGIAGTVVYPTNFLSANGIDTIASRDAAIAVATQGVVTASITNGLDTVAAREAADTAILVAIPTSHVASADAATTAVSAATATLADAATTAGAIVSTNTPLGSLFHVDRYGAYYDDFMYLVDWENRMLYDIYFVAALDWGLKTLYGDWTITGKLTGDGSGLSNLTATAVYTSAWAMAYSDGTTNKQELQVGAAGSYLRSGGIGAAPSWGIISATATNVALSNLVDVTTNTWMPVGNGTYMVMRDPAFVRTNLSLVPGVNVMAYGTNFLYDTQSVNAATLQGYAASAFFQVSGAAPLTGNGNAGGYRWTNMANAVGAQDAATLAQVQSATTDLVTASITNGLATTAALNAATTGLQNASQVEAIVATSSVAYAAVAGNAINAVTNGGATVNGQAVSNGAAITVTATTLGVVPTNDTRYLASVTNGGATVNGQSIANGASIVVAPFTNAWSVLYSDAATNAVTVPLGAANTYLRSAGASTAPTFEVMTVTATNLPPGSVVVTNTGVAGQFIQYQSGAVDGVITTRFASATGTGDFLSDGTVPMAANLNAGGYRVTNMAAGVAATDAVNLGQLQTATQGLVTASVTNGLDSYAAATQREAGIVASIPSTNGLAPVSYVDAATNTLRVWVAANAGTDGAAVTGIVGNVMATGTVYNANRLAGELAANYVTNGASGITLGNLTARDIITFGGVSRTNWYTAAGIATATTTRAFGPVANWTDIAMSTNGQWIGAVAYGSNVWTTLDAGTNIFARDPDSPYGAYFYGIAASYSGEKVALVGSGTRAPFTSTDYGATFTARNLGLSSWVNSSVASDSTGAKLQAGNYGSVKTYYSVNSGANWTTASGSRMAAKICSSSNGTYIAVGGGTLNFDSSIAPYIDYIYTSINAGTNFTQRASARNWRGMACDRTGKYLVASAWNNYVWISSDYGTNWQPRIDIRYWGQTAMAKTGGICYAVASNDYVYMSFDYGTNFFPLTELGVKAWRVVACDDSGRNAVVGASGQQLQYIQYNAPIGGSIPYAESAGVATIASTALAVAWPNITGNPTGNTALVSWGNDLVAAAESVTPASVTTMVHNVTDAGFLATTNRIIAATNTIAAASLTGTINNARLSGITSNQIDAATDAAYRSTATSTSDVQAIVNAMAATGTYYYATSAGTAMDATARTAASNAQATANAALPATDPSVTNARAPTAHTQDISTITGATIVTNNQTSVTFGTVTASRGITVSNTSGTPTNNFGTGGTTYDVLFNVGILAGYSVTNPMINLGWHAGHAAQGIGNINIGRRSGQDETATNTYTFGHYAGINAVGSNNVYIGAYLDQASATSATATNNNIYLEGATGNTYLGQPNASLILRGNIVVTNIPESGITGTVALARLSGITTNQMAATERDKIAAALTNPAAFDAAGAAAAATNAINAAFIAAKGGVTNALQSWGFVDPAPTSAVQNVQWALWPATGTVRFVRGDMLTGSVVADLIERNWTNAAGNYTIIYTGLTFGVVATNVTFTRAIQANYYYALMSTNVAAGSTNWTVSLGWTP